MRSLTLPKRVLNFLARLYIRPHYILFLFLSVMSFLGFSAGYQAEAKGAKSKETVHYSIKKLPKLVRKMHQSIYRAARSGDLDEMRAILETNELLPLINDQLIRKPVDYWINESVAKDGLSIFATMSRILESGYLKREGKKGEALYIWPYFAETNVKTLKPHQKVQLYRTVSAQDGKDILQSGRYTSYSLGIGEDGTWHFFRKNK